MALAAIVVVGLDGWLAGRLVERVGWLGPEVAGVLRPLVAGEEEAVWGRRGEGDEICGYIVVM